MPSRLLALSALALAATVPTSGASAQRNPGAPGGDGVSASTFRAEYFAEVVPQVNELMEAWGRAWSEDDARGLAELYTENAVLLPLDGAPVTGRDALVEHFASTLPGVGSMEAFMQDFDGSGGMAFVYGTFLGYRAPGDAGGGMASGELVTVFARQGRDWRIRAQTFRPQR